MKLGRRLLQVNVTLNQETKFILGAVYIHPNVLQEAIEYFMSQMFGAYSEAIRLIFPNMNPDTETPILLCGDFNMDILQNIICELYEIQIQFGLHWFRVYISGHYVHRSNIH